MNTQSGEKFPLSLTSDFLSDTGCAEGDLRALAAAGFTHVHWCHQWNTDFLYGRAEMEQIGRWLEEFGLKLPDLHGSAGREKCWWSQREYERLAGVELVENRLRMTAQLGGNVVVMHVPALKEGEEKTWEQLRRSMDSLVTTIRGLGVRLAIENMRDDDFGMIRRLLEAYGPEVVGVCYDCGHGNIGARRGLEYLEAVKERLIALHLHDNDGTRDQHGVPFTGTVDFPQLMSLVARSGYRGCITLESNVKSLDEAARATFLGDAYRTAERLRGMVVETR